MKRLEALADALASLNDWTDPDSDAYKLRNPGLLRAFTLRHAMNGDGRRVFPCLVDGYQALLYDLDRKCRGLSRSKLKPESRIVDLLTKGFGQPSSAEEFVLCFLQRALPNVSITSVTPLRFFVEEN